MSGEDDAINGDIDASDPAQISPEEEHEEPDGIPRRKHPIRDIILQFVSLFICISSPKNSKNPRVLSFVCVCANARNALQMRSFVRVSVCIIMRMNSLL